MLVIEKHPQIPRDVFLPNGVHFYEKHEEMLEAVFSLGIFTQLRCSYLYAESSELGALAAVRSLGLAHNLQCDTGAAEGASAFQLLAC